MSHSVYRTFAIGGDLTVDRVGFGAMRLARIQNLFDPAHADEAALAEHAAAEQIAFVPYGPLGSGQPSARDERYATIARRHGATVAQVALAHVLALSPSTLAIPRHRVVRAPGGKPRRSLAHTHTRRHRGAALTGTAHTRRRRRTCPNTRAPSS